MKQYSPTKVLHMVDDVETESTTTTTGRFVERGVSVDQDGKSNVWAIEPSELKLKYLALVLVVVF